MELEKTNYKQFTIICVIAFAIFMSNQMVVYTVTKYANEMSASTQMIGLIGGMFGISALLIRPFAGMVVDNKAHKPLLFASIGGLIASNIVLVLATGVEMLIVSRLLNGIAWGFGSTVCMTTACNALPAKKIASGIGLYSMMQTLAQVVGPSVALAILERGTFTQLYMVTTAIMCAALLLALLFKSNHVPAKPPQWKFTLRGMFAPGAFVPASLLMCNTMQVAAVASFLLLYADSIGVGGLSFFFTLQALTIVATRPLVSRFIKDKNIYAFAIASECLIITGLLNLFFAGGSVGFMISAVLFGMGKSGAQPALTSLCIASVPGHERGRASNTSLAFQDIGQFAGSYIAGLAVGMWGYRFAFSSIAGVVAIGLAVFIITYMLPHLRTKKEATSDGIVDD